jgi:hypothetical protein
LLGGLLVLVLWSTGRSLGNGFAFDDVPIVAENQQIHELAPPWVYARQSYWPPDNLGDAYRPLTIWGLALQWTASGGRPVVFHAVNLFLTALATILAFRLGMSLLPLPGAWLAAAWFAVHPVHVEATGNIVGQAELWMIVFVVLAVSRYLEARSARGTLTARDRLGLCLLLVLASAAKEQGIILPLLLLLAEFTVLRGRGQPHASPRNLLATFLALGVTLAAFLAGRYLVLGDLGAGPPAAGISGLTLSERTVAMLPIVPHWIRLLFWPEHLAAQYSPPAFPGPTQMTGVAWLGLAAAVAVLGLMVAGFRRAPVVTFGLGWCVLSLGPVSNVLFPTGIIIAERTLFLPSVGVVLAGGWLASAWITKGSHRRSLLVSAAALVLVVLGAVRSWSRQAVWRDNPTLFRQTIIDAPTSYRSYFVAGKDLQRRRKYDDAATMYQHAADLYGEDRQVFEEWGQVLRSEGRCDEAVPVLERGVRVAPTATLARSRLMECLITLKRYSEAERVAQEGVRLGGEEFKQGITRVIRVRDSLASSAPAPRARG